MFVLALSHGFRLLVFIDHRKWQFAAVAPREGGAHVITVDQQSWREGLKIRGEMNSICRFPDAAFCISDADYTYCISRCNLRGGTHLRVR